jgi:hypothetical protein
MLNSSIQASNKNLSFSAYFPLPEPKFSLSAEYSVSLQRRVRSKSGQPLMSLTYVEETMKNWWEMRTRTWSGIMRLYREYEWPDIKLVRAVGQLGLTCNDVTNFNLLLWIYISCSGLTWTLPCIARDVQPLALCGTCHLIYHCAWHYTSSTNCPAYRVTLCDVCWFL